ncbi:MAG TPA: Calx-beta domain-containing protein, partial [Acidimicrobiales bacterium]
ADGGAADGPSAAPSVSDDGRFVAFASDAADLVAGDANRVRDVFVRDRVAGKTVLVSADAAGGPADGPSGQPAISGDGRYVAFASAASDLVPGDGNGVADVFLRDLAAGTTVRVSVDRSGGDADGASRDPAVDDTGRVVAFASDAGDLVRGDGNGLADVFVRDLAAGRTERVSVDVGGDDAGGASSSPSLSDDGRRVEFESFAADLVPDDGGHALAVFVRDRPAGRTVKASVTPGGGQAAWSTGMLSGDGRWVVFAAVEPVAPGGLGPGRLYRRDLAGDDSVALDLDLSGGPPQRSSSSRSPSVSDDGRFVAFATDAADLVPEDHDMVSDVVVRDAERGTTAEVSTGSGPASGPAISGDGSVVAFVSAAGDVVPGDGNGEPDVFARPRPRPGPVPPPVVGVGDVTVAEGDEGRGTAWAALTLSRAAAADVRVAWTTADGTAVAPADYASASGVVVIEAGSTVALVPVAVAPDTEVEPDERLSLRITGVEGPATAGRRTATVTIGDDDPPGPIALTVGDATVVEGDDGSTQATFTVRLSRPAAGDVVIGYATGRGSATATFDPDPSARGDYVGYRAGQATAIPAGEVETTIGVVVLGDLDPEGDESFGLAVEVLEGGATVADGLGIGTVVDDDGAAPAA